MLPVGDYRFRADQAGGQYWSGSQNHCPVPGCTSAGITLPAPLGILDSQGPAFFQPVPETLSVSLEQIFPTGASRGLGVLALSRRASWISSR